MAEFVELRVHAGASSDQQHEKQYVAQAEAYASRSSRNVERIISFTSAADQIGVGHLESTRAGNQISEDSTTVSEVLPLETDSYIEDTQLAYTALQSQLFTSSAAIVPATPAGFQSRSPRNFERNIGQQTRRAEEQLQDKLDDEIASPKRVQDAKQTPQTPQTPPSQSSYLRSPVLSRSAKRLRLGGPPRSDGHSSRRLTASVSPNASGQKHTWQATKRVKTESNHGSAEDTVISDESTSEMPTSYSLSDIASESSSGRPQLSDRTNSDPGPVEHRHRGSLDGQEPLSDERVEGTVVELAVGPDHEADTTRNSPERRQVLSPEPLTTAQQLSFEIHAPPARTSVDPFVTHITKAMRQVADTFPDTYSPITVTRNLAIHERGYWLLHCATWTPAKQAAMWHLLEISISNGSMGWGVWCTRATDERVLNTDPKLSTRACPEQGDRSSHHLFGPLRLYCFGEVVRHMYLLLYTASEGSVRKAGLQWIDSAGEVVVQMKG